MYLIYSVYFFCSTQAACMGAGFTIEGSNWSLLSGARFWDQEENGRPRISWHRLRVEPHQLLASSWTRSTDAVSGSAESVWIYYCTGRTSPRVRLGTVRLGREFGQYTSEAWESQKSRVCKQHCIFFVFRTCNLTWTTWAAGNISLLENLPPPSGLLNPLQT